MATYIFKRVNGTGTLQVGTGATLNDPLTKAVLNTDGTVSLTFNSGASAYGYTITPTVDTVTVDGVTYNAASTFYTALLLCYPISGNYNTEGTVATLSSATSNGNSTDQTNDRGKGVIVGINVSAITGTSPTLVVTLQGKDAGSGVYYNILSSASITATGFSTLTLYPGATVAANSSASSPLPRTWRITYTIGGTTPAVTATIGASVII